MLCNHIAAVVCGGSANRLQRYEITLRHYVMSKTCGDIVGHYHGWKSRNNALEEACHKCSNLSLALAQLLFLSCCFIVSLYIRSLLCELMFVRPSVSQTDLQFVRLFRLNIRRLEICVFFWVPFFCFFRSSIIFCFCSFQSSSSSRVPPEQIAVVQICNHIPKFVTVAHHLSSRKQRYFL